MTHEINLILHYFWWYRSLVPFFLSSTPQRVPSRRDKSLCWLEHVLGQLHCKWSRSFKQWRISIRFCAKRALLHVERWLRQEIRLCFHISGGSRVRPILLNQWQEFLIIGPKCFKFEGSCLFSKTGQCSNMRGQWSDPILVTRNEN